MKKIDTSNLQFLSNGIVDYKGDRRFSRSGFIRAGKTNAKGQIDRDSNTPFFLVTDINNIPLDTPLGKEPKEIYFTVLEDDGFFTADLRYWGETQLICRGNGNGTAAAYYDTRNNNAAGLTNQTHPHDRKARVRVCSYKDCPDFISSKCKHNITISAVIPQISMVELFQYSATSQYALNDFLTALNIAKRRTLYKRTETGSVNSAGIKGMIFKMFKKMNTVPFETSSGHKGTKDTYTVCFEPVPFETYEKMFKDKIRAEDWELLVYLRSLGINERIDELIGAGPVLSSLKALDEPSGAPALEHKPKAAEIPFDGVDPELEAVADHPEVIKRCQLLSEYGMAENTHENRLKLATVKRTVQECVNYLDARLKDAKKKGSPEPTTKQLPQEEKKEVAAAKAEEPMAAAPTELPPAPEAAVATADADLSLFQ